MVTLIKPSNRIYVKSIQLFKIIPFSLHIQIVKLSKQQIAQKRPFFTWQLTVGKCFWKLYITLIEKKIAIQCQTPNFTLRRRNSSSGSISEWTRSSTSPRHRKSSRTTWETSSRRRIRCSKMWARTWTRRSSKWTRLTRPSTRPKRLEQHVQAGY